MDSQLKIFYTTALLSSFTKAAQVLNLTQPAITFQIKKLEDEYNTRLFNRDTNKISLTHAGKILFRRSEKILGEYEKISSEIAKATGILTGKIRIGVGSLLGKYSLPKLIGHFKNEHPDVEILMLVGNSASLVHKLKQHALDLIIISEPLSAQRFIVKPFIDDELVVIVNPNHRWTNNQHITLKDLFKESIIDREKGSGTREVFYNFLQSNSVSIKDLKVVMTMGSSEAVKSAVESGVAYGIVSKIAVRREIEMGLLKKINIKDTKLRRKFLVAYPTKLYNKHLISTFLDFMLTKKDELL
ncbi:LysR substrate-binding domain-containing protein [Thermodesulfobacteriota bacterium]